MAPVASVPTRAEGSGAPRRPTATTNASSMLARRISFDRFPTRSLFPANGRPVKRASAGNGSSDDLRHPLPRAVARR